VTWAFFFLFPVCSVCLFLFFLGGFWKSVGLDLPSCGSCLIIFRVSGESHSGSHCVYLVSFCLSLLCFAFSWFLDCVDPFCIVDIST